MQVMSSVTDTPQTLSEVIDRIERIREELLVLQGAMEKIEEAKPNPTRPHDGKP